jgi:hypothetical protein
MLSSYMVASLLGSRHKLSAYGLAHKNHKRTLLTVLGSFVSADRKLRAKTLNFQKTRRNFFSLLIFSKRSKHLVTYRQPKVSFLQQQAGSGVVTEPSVVRKLKQTKPNSLIREFILWITLKHNKLIRGLLWMNVKHKKLNKKFKKSRNVGETLHRQNLRFTKTHEKFRCYKNFSSCISLNSLLLMSDNTPTRESTAEELEIAQEMVDKHQLNDSQKQQLLSLMINMESPSFQPPPPGTSVDRYVYEKCLTEKQRRAERQRMASELYKVQAQLDEALKRQSELEAAFAKQPMEVDGHAKPSETPGKASIHSNERKLPAFSGKANTIKLSEFMDRFADHCKLHEVPENKKASVLKAYCTDDARAHLSTILVAPETSEEELFALYEQALQNKYGLPQEAAFKALLDVKYKDDKDNADSLASRLVTNANIALKGIELSAKAKSQILALFYWNAITKTAVIRQLRCSWKDGDRTLESAVACCRGVLNGPGNSEDDYALTGSEVQQSGNKPWQKGVKKTIQKNLSGNTNYNSQNTCSICGGWYHGYWECPAKGKGKGKGEKGGKGKGKGNNNNGKGKGKVSTNDIGSETKPKNRIAILPVFTRDGVTYLIDSGCSTTIFSSLGLERVSAATVSDIDREKSRYSSSAEDLKIKNKNKNCFISDDVSNIRTLDGITSACVIKNINVLGATLPRALMIDNGLQIANRTVDVLLGMDFITMMKGINISFTQSEMIITMPKLEKPLVISEDCSFLCDENVEPEYTVTALIEKLDFTARRLTKTNGDSFWQFTWHWENGEPEPHFGPAFYDLPENEDIRKKFYNEIETWVNEGYVVPAPKGFLKAVTPIMAIPQLHKSTPVRPVMNYEWLNTNMKSSPNEGRKAPISCPEYIRRWRAKGISISDLYLLDIRKAYMQVRADPSQTCWQGIRLPWREDHQDWYMSRLGFGLNVAPKILTAILDFIWQENDLDVESYIDDIIAHKKDIEKIREALKKNGFEIKEPESATGGRILGLEINDKGNWRRKGPTPKLETMTPRGISSWAGKLESHYPRVSWLRPICHAIKRLCMIDLDYPNAFVDKNLEKEMTDKKRKQYRKNAARKYYDSPLSTKFLKICEKIQKEIDSRGDPVTGEWAYSSSERWSIFTDASASALGAVLRVGDKIIEDTTALRKLTDFKHINIAELQAVELGFTLVNRYRQSLHLTDPIDVDLYVDNSSVLAWLTRGEARHWRQIKGKYAPTTGGILQAIAENCKAAKINLIPHYIPTEENIADELSRVPEYMRQAEMRGQKCENHEVVDTMMLAAEFGPDMERDEHGKIIIKSEKELEKIMTSIHAHEGSKALFDNLRSFINFKGLNQKCRQFVKNCETCKQVRPTSEMVEVAKKLPSLSNLQGNTPFEYIHLDIAGPYLCEDGTKSLHVVTLVCNYSGYALVRPTSICPSSIDTVALVRSVVDVFNTVPEIVHTDNGSQFQSDFTGYLTELNCRHVRSPIAASFCNGRVERFHRILNERLRAFIEGVPRPKEFAYIIKKATQSHNVTVSSTTGCSPHDLVFNFKAWIYPQLRHYKPKNQILVSSLKIVANGEQNTVDNQLPKPGEVWLAKTKNLQTTKKKFERPFKKCHIVGRVSNKIFRVRTESGKVKNIHIRQMKKLKEHPDEENNDQDLSSSTTAL